MEPPDAAVPARNLGYIPALDGFRAVAVLAVIANHTRLSHTEGSGIGVFLFFTLSGFLITSLLLQERASTGEVSLRAFYARRALRLLPALAVFLVGTVVYMVVFGHGQEKAVTLHSVPSVVFYFANWRWYFVGVESLGRLAHTWSLSVEEQFYILWPVTLLALRRLRWPSLVAVIVVASGVPVLFRVFTYHGDSHPLAATHVVADHLLLGCGLAVLLRCAGDDVRARLASAFRVLFWPAIGFLAFVGLAVAGSDRWFVLVGWTLTALAACVIIGRVVLTPDGLPVRVLAWRPLVYIGRISYGMYLWHLLLLAPHRFQFHDTLRARVELVAWAYGATILVASLSFWLIERPALRLKRRFEPALLATRAGLAPSQPVEVES